jgi:hypothetical protein
MTFRIALISLVAIACSKADPPPPCAPTTPFTGGGTIHVASGDYAVSTAKAEDFLNGGSLTMTAAAADAGTGKLDPNDPVVAISMTPTPDQPGTYTLASLKAQIAYCNDGKLAVDSTGKLAACIDSAGATQKMVTAALDGTVDVESGKEKKLDGTAQSGIEVHIGFGQQAQTCQ